MQARRIVKEEGCPFCLAVPESGLDVLFLFNQGAALPMVNLFQHVLRAACATGRKVDRAALMQEQIVLEVDGILVGFGPDRLPERRTGVYYRPKGTRRPHNAARLGHILQCHQVCLRLRVGLGASDALLQELAQSVCVGNTPKAVVLISARLVLSWTEFLHHAPGQLDALLPGPILPRPVARYARPPAPEGAGGPRLFDSSKRLMSPGGPPGYDPAMMEHRMLQSAVRGARGGPAQRARTVPRLIALVVAALSGVVLALG